MHRAKTMRRTKITALIALSSVSAFFFAFSLTSPAGGETRGAAAANSQSHRTTAVPISDLNAVSNVANSNGSYKDLVAPQAAPSPCNTYSYFVSTGSIVPGTTDTGNHTDDDSTVIALPFSYQLYDSTFDTVVVGSNGHLTFGTVNDDWDLTCIPIVISTYAIGPYWTDLCTGACDNVTGENLGVFTSTSGNAPNRIFNIEWRAAYYYNGNQATNIPLNFEIRLYEGLGQFDIIYGTMQPTFTPPDARTLTVGVQRSDTSLNTLVGCDTSGGASPPVSSGQLYHFFYHFVKEGCSTPSPTATATAAASPPTTPTPTTTPTLTPTPTPSPTPTPTPNCGDVFLDENFDGVTAPALPPGWSSSVTYLGSKICAPTCPPLPNWTTSTTAPHSAPNCAFHFGAGCLSASSLYSPSFSNNVGGDFLFFQHSYDFQTGGDGAVLEFSLNGGAFTDFVAAGGNFLNGSGYNGTLSYFGRQAWTGTSGGYRPVVAMMPPGSQGNVVLRFVILTDCSVESVGWRLDDIEVASFGPCPSPTPSPTPTATPTPTPGTATPSPTPAPSPTPTPCVNYAYTVNTGTIVPGTTNTGNSCDDCSTSVFLPFSYQLYDTVFNRVFVGSNGHLTFGAINNSFSASCIPQAVTTYAIFPYRTDLCTGPCAPYNTGSNLGIFTSISGSAPNRVFNIEWRAAYYFWTPTTNIQLNFEVRLYEGQTAFDVVYGTITPKSTANDGPLSVGVQKNTSFYTLEGCDPSGGTSPPVSSGQVYHYTLGNGCPIATPSPSPTPTATATASPAPTATATASPTPPSGCESTPTGPPPMSGNVYYCSTSAPMQGVTIRCQHICGFVGTTTTDSSGFYVIGLPGFCKSGNGGFLTPSQADRIPGSPGINTIDVLAVQQHFLIIGPPLSGCRLTAGDVNGDGSINTTDVVAIQRFYLGFSTGIANVGRYQFNPPNACFNWFNSHRDFSTIIFGDVATPFIY